MANKEDFYTIFTAMLLLHRWSSSTGKNSLPQRFMKTRRWKNISRLAQRGASLYYLWRKIFSVHVCKSCIWRMEMCIRKEVKMLSFENSFVERSKNRKPWKEERKIKEQNHFNIKFMKKNDLRICATVYCIKKVELWCYQKKESYDGSWKWLTREFEDGKVYNEGLMVAMKFNGLLWPSASL